MIEISGVILDYGNVISHPQSESDIDQMAQALGLTRADFEHGYWHRRLDYDQNLDPSDYWQSVSAHTSRKLTAEQMDRATQLDCESWSRANPIMLSWINMLHDSGIPVALLSNMPAPIARYLEERCDWFPHFSHTVFSCRVGCAKPQKDIYERCLREAGMQPSTTLFLDDRQDNIEAAQSLGINSILFTEPNSTFQTLSKRFHLPLPQ